MKKHYDKIVAITETLSINSYTISIGFSSGKKFFLGDFADEEGVMSFRTFERILSETPLNDIYELKNKIKCSNLIINNFIDNELRRRHKPLVKKEKTLKQQLKGNEKQIILPNGQTLIRASQIKEK